jgi:hypothetical protein
VLNAGAPTDPSLPPDPRAPEFRLTTVALRARVTLARVCPLCMRGEMGTSEGGDAAVPLMFVSMVLWWAFTVPNAERRSPPASATGVFAYCRVRWSNRRKHRSYARMKAVKNRTPATGFALIRLNRAERLSPTSMVTMRSCVPPCPSNFSLRGRKGEGLRGLHGDLYTQTNMWHADANHGKRRARGSGARTSAGGRCPPG